MHHKEQEVICDNYFVKRCENGRRDVGIIMKILFLEGDMSRRGGTERMTAMLANELCKEYDVWIISIRLKEEKVFFDLDNKINHTVLTSEKEKVSVLHQIKVIHSFIRKNGIDVVINVDVGMCIFGIPAAWGTDAKVITWEHANFYNNWNSKVFPYFRRFAARCSDAMVVLTQRDKENYQANIKSKKPIYVIPNPSDKHDFQYNVQSKIILSAGLLLPIKGYDLAIQVAQKVLLGHPDWKWVICGEGPERAHLEEMIQKAGVSDQMLLVGTIKDMDEQYKKSAMYVLTSKMEGLPMVLLDAKAWGLPIVSFDIMTGPSDIIRDDVNGYLIKPDDIDDLAVKIEELIVNQEKRELFSENSQIDMEKFNFCNIVDKWKKVMRLK